MATKKISELESGENKIFTFDDALEITGNGRYNYRMLAISCFIFLAIGIDLFGFPLIITGACDLNLTITEIGILTSVPYIAILVSSYMWGYISDTRGRRFTLIISMHVAFVLSSLCSICPRWQTLAAMKFASVFFSCAANSVTYAWLGESCIPRVRRKFTVFITTMLILSSAVAAVITYSVLNMQFQAPLWLGFVFTPWRLLVLIMAAPIGMAAVCLTLMKESPKFLANCGKTEEALDVLAYIYAVNNACSTNAYKVKALVREAKTLDKESFIRNIYDQSAPLFRPPLLWRTVQLFYLSAIVYTTNNAFGTWLPQVLNMAESTLTESTNNTGNLCSAITRNTFVKITANTTSDDMNPDICMGNIKFTVMVMLMLSESTFAFLNYVVAYLARWRKVLIILNLGISALSLVLVNVIPDTLTSIVFCLIVPCTCLSMGSLASYFVDIYPTSYRGMAVCLSLMAGRSASFIGINIFSNLIFQYCEPTLYVWAFVLVGSMVVACYLPSERDLQGKL